METAGSRMEDVEKELDLEEQGAVGGRPRLQCQTSVDGEVESLTETLHLMTMPADGVVRSESSDSGYTTVSGMTSHSTESPDVLSDGPSCSGLNDEDDSVGQSSDQSRPAPVSFTTTTSTSNNPSRPSIVKYTVNITGCPNQTTIVQIGDGNVQHIRDKEESDRQMVPLRDDFVRTLVEVHHPGGEEDMIKRLHDPAYVRQYVKKMKEQNVPHSIKKFGRGCIFLELEVEDPADAQRLVEMCCDGSYQRILMETFLPEYVASGQPLGISLAITVRKPHSKVEEDAMEQPRSTSTAGEKRFGDTIDAVEKVMFARPGSKFSPKPPPQSKWTPAAFKEYIYNDNTAQDKKVLFSCSKGDDFSKPSQMPPTITIFPSYKQGRKQPMDVTEAFNPIADDVAPYWKDLAQTLHLKKGDILWIEARNLGDDTKCCLAVLQVWKSKMSDQATLLALYRALKDKTPGECVAKEKSWVQSGSYTYSRLICGQGRRQTRSRWFPFRERRGTSSKEGAGIAYEKLQGGSHPPKHKSPKPTPCDTDSVCQAYGRACSYLEQWDFSELEG